MSRLVGKQDVDFTNDRGEKVVGVKLHFLCKDDRVFGDCCATQFIGERHALYAQAREMPLGDFDFTYGPRGKVVGIVLPGAGK